MCKGTVEICVNDGLFGAKAVELRCGFPSPHTGEPLFCDECIADGTEDKWWDEEATAQQQDHDIN